ncbi:hypothetical protein HYPSUDRAFT_141069 [Hypholoma sublateritium FD-334 SS-4]|uniref:F-box domain-containing protein n=1 Tax=Hypholoma sublateritium (strain FD-334 SS-4) TaxID=945553 RepID=A0A0D2NXK8_HYPSF|nr:hypothetical protein HYPSUDRAFT_141069 [Hypholoma sublateritium FD-334 SS-4]
MTERALAAKLYIMGNDLRLEHLPLDIIYEILGCLSAGDIIRTRRVCRRLWSATFQQSVWGSAYKLSDLLLPDESLLTHSTKQLELCLVRAEKLHLNWTSSEPQPKVQRRFPRTLPVYNFDAGVISGRYLQVAEHNGISWYDLDLGDTQRPIMTYPCLNTFPTSGYLNFCENANGEGSDVVWVSFLTHSPRKICILKATFGNNGPKVQLHTEIKARNVTAVQMGYDWLLPVREFGSQNGLMDFFHIPSCSTMYFPMHEKVQNLSDLSNMKFAITPRFLFLMFPLRNETLVDVYPLPMLSGTLLPGATPKLLARSHYGIYPHAISDIRVMADPLPSRPFDESKCHTPSKTGSISFLALVYLKRSPTWTSKIGLHVLDAIVDPIQTLSFITRCGTILNVGMVTTSLALSARAGTCLAVTHSSPGPIIMAHYILKHQDSTYTMSVKPIKCHKELKSRQMLSFDGVRGRLCLINGWTYIDILDFA